MFTKTLFGLLAAIVLIASSANAQACVSPMQDEGTLSAYPSWQVCQR